MKKPFAPVFVLALLWVPGSAWAQDVDPQFKADTESLMQLTGSADVESVTKMVAVQLVDAIKRSQPNVSDRALVIVTEVITSEFSKAFVAPDGLRDRMVTIYTMHFTHDEVLALLNFYRTPVGRKAVSMMPTLMQEGQSAVLGWVNGNMTRIVGLIQQRLQSEGVIK